MAKLIVPGRLRRPRENGSKPRALSSLRRARARPGGVVYGRRTYEIMRYWDEDLPEWEADERDFAAAWRSRPKWVVSRSLKSVGPNATPVQNDVGTVLRELKARLVGETDALFSVSQRPRQSGLNRSAVGLRSPLRRSRQRIEAGPIGF